MLDSIKNTLVTNLPTANTLVYAAAAGFLGRNIVLSAGCKIRGLFDKQNSNQWNKASIDYLKLAKKCAVHELPAAGLAAIGIIASKRLLNEKTVPQINLSAHELFERLSKIGSATSLGILIGIGGICIDNGHLRGILYALQHKPISNLIQ